MGMLNEQANNAFGATLRELMNCANWTYANGTTDILIEVLCEQLRCIAVHNPELAVAHALDAFQGIALALKANKEGDENTPF